ncbi:N-dimethylarginine dimethylaminohydrolase [Chitinophaga dinghuensis]|uniref:N-dimethylarginine dimethylaminohydrolase n=1 Tax=Chitinophaga dinghuensis TaxID=1539050 RepID=A0A327VQI1_9BACT|nr:amidinotransferase [Chitinophaga dinghuensis]RAJ77555.1 N-dimethylarginine dimethylaminohydrolase [Chitinophaga dinghuensis]
MIYVESEFAPLKKVVLAQSEFGFPEVPRPDDLKFLAPEAVQESYEHKGKDFSVAFPDRQAEWELERETFRKVLEKYGVEILRPRMLTTAEKQYAGPDGYANFFARDPFFTIGNMVIEGSMRFLHRRNEILPVREVMLKEVYPAECTYVAAPRPEIAAPDDITLGPGPFIEGGDVLVLGKHIFVGQSGLASNALGARWLEKYLTPYGYTLEVVRLQPDILHLDCALGLIKDGLMVVCEAAFIDGIPQRLRDWQRIDVTYAETSNLATNGLPLSPQVYVTDPAFSHIGERVAEHGIQVEYVDFQISRSFGGSFRCSTQPFLRKS